MSLFADAEALLEVGIEEDEERVEDARGGSIVDEGRRVGITE